MEDKSGLTPGLPTGRAIEQRVRNRVIEYLELAASFDAQQRYQAIAPVNVPYEVINQWGDNFPHGPGADSRSSSVYSPDEAAALADYHSAWQAAAGAIPNDYPALETVQATGEWEMLRRSAEVALGIFMRRGVMPEDREAP